MVLAAQEGARNRVFKLGVATTGGLPDALMIKEALKK